MSIAPPWSAVTSTVTTVSGGKTVMAMPAEAGREFWRGVLVAGGFTAIPRWTLDATAGVGEYDAPVPDALVTAVHRLADDLAVPFSSVLLAAHATVLAALSGEQEVTTGYVTAGGRTLPCRLTTESNSWRSLLLGVGRVE